MVTNTLGNQFSRVQPESQAPSRSREFSFRWVYRFWSRDERSACDSSRLTQILPKTVDEPDLSTKNLANRRESSCPNP